MSALVGGVEREPMPVAGVDYPATFQLLGSWFGDEASCVDYLGEWRWPHGFVCPGCGWREYWRTAKGLWLCRSRKHKASAAAGTIFHRS